MAARGGVLDAQAFVEEYYRIVGTMAHAAHKLYADASLVTRPGPDGTMMSFSSLEDIKKHYLSSYYDGTTFDVLSVESQSSSGDGLFIMVVGFLTGKDNLKRKFSQAFYLARPNGGYAVVNDIQRFVDEESSTPRALPAAIHKATKKKSVNAAEVKKVVAVATPPLEKDVTSQKPKQTVAETSATPSVDGAKKSFASMVLSMSRNAAPLQVRAAPVQKPSSVAQPKPHAAPAPEKKTDQKALRYLCRICQWMQGGLKSMNCSKVLAPSKNMESKSEAPVLVEDALALLPLTLLHLFRVYLRLLREISSNLGNISFV
ncbi:hypothetical protein Bca52824_015461 [Brassica carinata]|uniref:NTF2 domain-containing protein n=1 Tax=Brassica carinata TaxID=52824 RepID=A0A8X7W1R9_BRACI|nr:hypothetical protein Bca52824_015461 [Brassica carinata]